MNLSQIIERKKEEFDEDFRFNFDGSNIDAKFKKKLKSFLEKAIRESVEEALLEIVYSEKVERECGCWANGRVSDYHLEKDCPGKLREYKNFDIKVKEFMK